MCRLTVAFMLLAASGQVAKASLDYNECSVPRWSLKGIDYDFCNNLPFLTPGNDSRVNLSLLIAEQSAAVSPERAHRKLDLRVDDQQFGYGSVPFMIEALVDGKGGSEPSAAANQASDDALTKAWSTVAAKPRSHPSQRVPRPYQSAGT